MYYLYFCLSNPINNQKWLLNVCCFNSYCITWNPGRNRPSFPLRPSELSPPLLTHWGHSPPHVWAIPRFPRWREIGSPQQRRPVIPVAAFQLDSGRTDAISQRVRLEKLGHQGETSPVTPHLPPPLRVWSITILLFFKERISRYLLNTFKPPHRMSLSLWDQ